MLEDLTGLIIPLAGMGFVLALRYLKLKSQSVGSLGAQEVAALEQMAATAQRLEGRVATLERILDSEVPAWRENPANFYQQASYER